MEQTIKVKRWDPLRALELMGRHLGRFKDKVEHEAGDSLLGALRRIEAREDEARESVAK